MAAVNTETNVEIVPLFVEKMLYTHTKTNLIFIGVIKINYTCKFDIRHHKK